MHSLALVPLFQEKLNVSKTEAIWRVIGILVLSLFALAIAAAVIINFPIHSSFTQTIPLLPGNHVQVSKILDGEVLVGHDQFLQVAQGNPTFVSPGDDAIVYYTKAGGVAYRYEEKVHLGPPYTVSSRIENGMVIRNMERDTLGMVLVFVVLPIIGFVGLLTLFVKLDSKLLSGYGSGSKYLTVWL
jgi:hypothetical protein